MEKTVDPANEIGENVTITERSQLLSITPKQAKKNKIPQNRKSGD